MNITSSCDNIAMECMDYMCEDYSGSYSDCYMAEDEYGVCTQSEEDGYIAYDGDGLNCGDTMYHGGGYRIYVQGDYISIMKEDGSYQDLYFSAMNTSSSSFTINDLIAGCMSTCGITVDDYCSCARGYTASSCVFGG